MIPASTLAREDFLAENSKITMQLSGIGKSFSGVNVLRGVDVQIVGGEIHTLMGENGAGKSTLVKIISGVQPQSAGTIEIDGE